MGCECSKKEAEEAGEYQTSKDINIQDQQENGNLIVNNSKPSHSNNPTASFSRNQETPSMLNYDQSFAKKKKKTKTKLDYDVVILPLFNLARTKPLGYCKHIDYAITLITTNFEGQLVIGLETTNKIGLREGISKFNECKRFILQSPTCKELIIDEDLLLEIPEDPNLWLDHNVIKKQIYDKQNEILSIPHKPYTLFGFHFDYGMIDPTLSSVLQLVDDNNCENRRRYNILNSDYKAVGISFKNQGKNFCSYFFFAG